VHDIRRLALTACQLRINIVKMMGSNKAHHFGGSMSAADLVTALYFSKMRYDPQNPAWPERDRFIMSKGHCVPAQYAALAMLGVFPLAELPTLKQMGTRLQGHPAAHLLPGIEGCTGSLGQGLSFANGMALAGRIQGLDYRVYCLIGDGETHEGQIWEAARSTPLHCLTNVTAILDRNGLKGMDTSYCGRDMRQLRNRWASFGWLVREIDGHDMAQICAALDWAEAETEAPCLILATTVKGKGISFMENLPQYHNASLSPQEIEQALGELECHCQTLEEANTR
jgi:transketolase